MTKLKSTVVFRQQLMDAKHSLPLSAVLAWKDFGMCVHEAIRFNHFDGRIQLFSEAPPLRRILQSVVGG